MRPLQPLLPSAVPGSAAFFGGEQSGRPLAELPHLKQVRQSCIAYEQTCGVVVLMLSRDT